MGRFKWLRAEPATVENRDLRRRGRELSGKLDGSFARIAELELTIQELALENRKLKADMEVLDGQLKLYADLETLWHERIRRHTAEETARTVRATEKHGGEV